ncbi:MAG: hypothetical protein R2744_09345 [Bacteroidales bacterium]
MAEVNELMAVAKKYSAESYIVPHSLYSLSDRLLSLVREAGSGNRVTSVHFMESPAEAEFLENGSGPIGESYQSMGLPPGDPERMPGSTPKQSSLK